MCVCRVKFNLFDEPEKLRDADALRIYCAVCLLYSKACCSRTVDYQAGTLQVQLKHRGLLELKQRLEDSQADVARLETAAKVPFGKQRSRIVCL